VAPEEEAIMRWQTVPAILAAIMALASGAALAKEPPAPPAVPRDFAASVRANCWLAVDSGPRCARLVSAVSRSWRAEAEFAAWEAHLAQGDPASQAQLTRIARATLGAGPSQAFMARFMRPGASWRLTFAGR
jgi:hypothetical protein